MTKRDLKEKIVAIPGMKTTAYLALRLYNADVNCVIVPFNKIPEYVARGKADAGLIIHEGQLTYRRQGLHKVVDLGEWWWSKTRLPLPLGGNGIHRRFSETAARRLEEIVKASILHGLENREKALRHAMTFSRGMTVGLSDRFVGMYVNDFTVDLGPKVKRAIRLLLSMGYAEGVLPRKIVPEFTSPTS